jgi:hypothetical protein
MKRPEHVDIMFKALRLKMNNGQLKSKLNSPIIFRFGVCCCGNEKSGVGGGFVVVMCL